MFFMKPSCRGYDLCRRMIAVKSRERIYDINRRLRTASNGWADLRVGRVIAFRCGLISGLHHQLEVIGPDKASRDFPAFDANFLIDQRKWSIFASGAGSGVSSFLEHLKKEGLRARNLLFQYKICRRTFFSRTNTIQFDYIHSSS